MSAQELGRRAQNKRLTRDRLANAAVHLVATDGLRATRVEQICDRAGVGRMTFFRYFDSKESALVEGVHRECREALLEALNNRPPEEGPFEAVRHAVLEASKEWRGFRDALLLEARIRAESPSVEAWAAASHVMWESAIVERIAARCNGVLEARLVASAAMTVIQTIFERWIEAGARRSPVPALEAGFATVPDAFGRNEAPRHAVARKRSG